MKRYELQVEFVTPCFLGGADKEAAAEWRAASIRGQLRWWFRSLAGGLYQGSHQRVRDAEALVFGNTDTAGAIRVRAGDSPQVIAAGGRCDYGRGRTAQQLASAWNQSDDATIARLRIVNRSNGSEIPSNPVQYLGYGAITWNRGANQVQFTHGRIEAGQRASICMDIRRELGDESEELLMRSLKAWLLLGGIGSKCRKGYGSLGYVPPQGAEAPSIDGLAPVDCEAYKAEVQGLLSHRCDARPDFSAVSASTQVLMGQEGKASWQDAMDLAGGWLIAFRRRYGVPTDPRGGKRNRDYTWAKPRATDLRGGYPDRGGFGLPLPFGQGGETLTWGDDQENRRASPLLIHIQKIGTLHYPVFTFLPARLIPQGERLKFKGAKQRGPEPTPEQYGIVGEFLDDLHRKSLLRRIDHV
jgi:CRISPR-associated protein Cmr1